MTVFFSLSVLFIFTLLFASFVTRVDFACVLNFTTTLCFIGIHEVARELENPYFAVPNDLPLNHFQAQFNEALVAGMLVGFHPDSWRRVGSQEVFFDYIDVSETGEVETATEYIERNPGNW